MGQRLKAHVCYVVFIVLLCGCGVAFAQQGTLDEHKRIEFVQAPRVAPDTATSELNVSLADDPAGRTINSGFLGANILYWIDNDEAWLNKGVPGRLQELGIKTLRYPGGEVADNYDWETNSVERKDKFPYEAQTEKERHGRLDYLEFLANAKKIGVENIFFVVNLEGAFFQPGDREASIEKYAEKAARWVKAVKEAGYRVQYWEIGNESYLGSAYALTAHEYVAALKVFYRKMKAADPSIKIGAIGPPGVKGIDAAGFADALGETGLGKFRTLIRKGEEPCKKAGRKECSDELGVPYSQRDSPVWWDVLLTEGRDSFDFAVIHRYRSERLQRKEESQPLQLKEQIRSLKDYLETRKRAKSDLALTEWNTPGKSHERVTEQEHVVDIAEQLGHYLEGGVDYALYWPWRIKGQWFSVMSEKDDRVSAVYSLFDLFQRYHRARLMRADYNEQQGVYVLASQDARGKSALLVNYTNNRKRVKMTYGTTASRGSLAQESVVGTESGSRLQKAAVLDLPARDPMFPVELPPRSVTGVQIIYK
jgi:hypothetical protein